MKWLCIQNGAREHYAIPRALKQSGRLEALFTAVWAGPVLRRLAFGPLLAIARRYHPELEDGRWRMEDGEQASRVRGQGPEVISWNWQTVWRELCSKGEWKKEKGEIFGPYHSFIRDGRWFSEEVRDYLTRRDADLRGMVVFSYDTTALELFRWAKGRGAVCVLGQMDPNRVEVNLVREEEKRWPGWALRPTDVPEEYFQRREAEWKLADRVVVNSRWSFEALVKQGVPPEKLAVIPLCFEEKAEMLNAEKMKTENRMQKADVSVSAFQFSASSPMRVLFLGQVVLRKGIQYLVESAKILQNAPVHFDVVGPIGLSDKAVKSVPSNLTFHGRANRNEAGKWYQQADVFVLPTLSDGFAITQLEAMAHGLPVIATPNCGEVVADGVDGFIVPARDVAALAEAIRRYIGEPELLRAHGIAARNKSGQFMLGHLADKLLFLEADLKRGKSQN